MFFNLFNSASNSDAVLLGTISEAETVSASDASALGFSFEPDNFLQALPTIGICMLAIFCVMLVIIGATALINKLGSIKPKAKSEDAE